MADPYPPPHHLLSDLGFEIDRSGAELVVRLPVSPALLDAAGSVRAGVLGLALDVFAGGLSVEAARPDWALTSELSVHALRPCAEGPLVVSGQTLRSGRTQLVVEARVHASGGGAPLALGHVGFTRVPRREDTPPSPETPGGVYHFGDDSTPLATPLLEALALKTLDAGAGRLEVPLTPYVRNSVGALQGGAVVTLVDASAAAAAASAFGAPAAVRDLTTRFLALGRGGPIRSEATLLRRSDEEVLVRVELRDPGQDERLVSLGTAIARRA